MKHSTLVLSVLLLSACKLNSNSSNKGFHESQTAEESKAYIGTLRAVPEYRDTAYVVLSEGLSRPDFNEAIEKAGAKVIVAPSQSVWARDWSGFSVKTNDGKNAIAEMNYYPDRESDDNTPFYVSKFLKVPRISVPLFLEGGNFMNNDSGLCIVTTWAIEEQEQSEEEYLALDPSLSGVKELQNEIRANRIGRDETKFKKVLADYLGCPKGVKVMKRMPREGTGHIDMWAKFISDNVVLVNKLKAGAPQTAENIELETFLSERTAEFEAEGLTVVRLPMPVPETKIVADTDGSAFEVTVFRSYTNFLQVNGHALVPSYGTNRVTSVDYSKQKFTRIRAMSRAAKFESSNSTGTLNSIGFGAGYEGTEKAVQDILTANGLKVTWMPAEQLIRMGGAVHCTTMQMAR